MSLNKGRAELLLFKGDSDYIKSNKLWIEDLHSGLYIPTMESPMPLDEIDSPYDIYKHYCHIGVLEIHDSLSESDLEREVDCGDVILIDNFQFKNTTVYMLVEKDTFSEKMNRHYSLQRDDSSVDDYPLYMYDLKVHSGFQDYWGHP